MSWTSIERVATWVLLATIAWPGIRALVSRPFRRDFPRPARWLLAATALYLTVATFVTVSAPVEWLRLLSVAAVVVLVAYATLARAALGGSRRWPPGSLRLLPLGPWFDRDYFFDQSRRHGRIFKFSQLVRPAVGIVGLAGGHELLRRHEASLASPPMDFGRFIPGGFLRHLPPERHGAVKAALADALSREVHEAHDAQLRGDFRAELERAAGGDPVAPRALVQRAVFRGWIRLFYGIEPESAEHRRLAALYRTIDIRNPRGVSDRGVREALAGIATIARAAATAAPDAEPPPSFVAALARRRPEALADDAIVLNLAYVLHTTWADVSGLLVWILRQLTEHPGWAERVAGERGDGDAAPPLPVRVVLETLRLEQSEYLYRATTCPIEHDGHVIPAGWLIRLCVHESHRDPEVFERPDAFDPDRFLGRRYAREEYSPFGAGSRHACLGERLTVQTGAAFVEELCRGYTWRTLADGPPEHSAWRHWRPSSDWRIALARRT